MVRIFYVEVVDAKDVIPKDSRGTSSLHVELTLKDGKKLSTKKTEVRNTNPVWNQTLSFSMKNVADTLKLYSNDIKTKRQLTLGLTQIKLDKFVPIGKETLKYYKLKKNGWFNSVSGAIGVKLYYEDVGVGIGVQKEKMEFKHLEENEDPVAMPWIKDTRGWQNPKVTIFVHVLLVINVWFPHLVVPLVGLCVLSSDTWSNRIHLRYRGRAMVKRCRDLRVVGILVFFCLVGVLTLILVPFKIVVMVCGFYYLRHPVLRRWCDRCVTFVTSLVDRKRK